MTWQVIDYMIATRTAVLLSGKAEPSYRKLLMEQLVSLWSEKMKAENG